MFTHNLYSWVAGDDFRLNLQLTDQDNEPYEIDDLEEILWLIHNPHRQIVPHDSVISTIDSASGRISVWIPASETTKWSGGIYTDWLRIICGGITSTLLTGPISVTADPWKHQVAVEPFAFAFRSTEEIVVAIDQKERIARRRQKRAA